MITCRKCKVEKPNSEMRPWGGKPSSVCLECSEANKQSGGGSVKAKATKPAPEAPAETAQLLVLTPGFGVSAVAENGQLALTQAAEGGEATVVLSRTEAKALFEQFSDWANA